MNKLNISKLDFAKMGGLIPAIIQDFSSGEVLMLGFMNKEALRRTMREGVVTFYSRTKQCLWKKGETSGNFLKVVSVKTDCDNDTLLIKANPKGPTCHEGSKSCFGKGEFGIKTLFALIKNRKKYMPKDSYTSDLFKLGLPKIIDKIEEESGEVMAAAQGEGKKRLVEESCDLIYHLWVLLVSERVEIEDVEKELSRRNGATDS